ncbi:MAG: ABC transporter ATP-binding protein [Fervidicoccaceae archaeon]
MLRTSSLCSGYGKLRVLFDVNFEAKRSEITVVVGPNGAGKTTLLNSVAGMATIHGGKILLDGQEITGLQPYIVTKLGISYVPQIGNVFAGLTVEENLRLACYGLPDYRVSEKLEEIYAMFPVLKTFAKRKAETLSGGERRMLAIGMGLMRNPRVLLLDEITTDLAPVYVKKVLDKVVELRDSLKLTVVLVEQYAARALQIADRAYLLVSGRIKYEGDPASLASHPELSKLYLGL